MKRPLLIFAVLFFIMGINFLVDYAEYFDGWLGAMCTTIGIAFLFADNELKKLKVRLDELGGATSPPVVPDTEEA